MLAEIFVDPQRFAGTCYRAANWLEIGQTQGYRRVRGAPRGYQAHGLPKRVFVYPLHRQARTQLAASQPQPSWQARCPRILLTPAQWYDLYAYLDQVPDTRHRQGRRYPMRTVLTILIAARLAGCQSLTELSDFGRALDPSTLQAIRSYRCARTGRYAAPGIRGWHSILRTIPVGQVERLLAAWTAAQVLPPPAAKAAGKGAAEPLLSAVAIDGKVLRGSYDRDLDAAGQPQAKPPQQQLSALDIDSGTVVAQLGFSGQKEDAEAAALRRLTGAQLHGRKLCVLADALHTQRETAAQLLADGFDFLLTVKGNQPTLLEPIRDGFDWTGQTPHSESGLDHRRIEQRTLRVSQELDPKRPWLEFPGVRCVAQVRREVEFKKDGRQRQPETIYLVTSLRPDQITPQRLLQLNRDYWGIENRVHYVRDVALREDRSRIRKGALPRLLAAISNFALSLLRLLPVQNIQRRMSPLRFQPNAAVRLLLG